MALIERMQEGGQNLWLTDIVLAFRQLQEDGIVWLQNVYELIRKSRKGLPRNFAAAIRATIYTHSIDSDAYIEGNPDVFRKVARGGWMLRLPNEEVPQNPRCGALSFPE